MAGYSIKWTKINENGMDLLRNRASFYTFTNVRIEKKEQDERIDTHI